MKLDCQLVAVRLCYTIHTTLSYQDTKILTVCSLKALAPARYKSTVTDPFPYTVKTVCRISLCPDFVSTYVRIKQLEFFGISMFYGHTGHRRNLGGGGGQVGANDPPVFFTHNKGTAIPLQAWTCPEGSRRLRLPDFKTIGT